MTNDIEFARDSEFRKVLLRDHPIDLTLVALEIARDAQPDLDFAPTLSWLDEQAALCRGQVARSGPDLASLRHLCEHLGGNCGLHGAADCYDLPESSFLPDVIRTRRGLPITLSLVYIAVAERLGLPLTGAATQGHFVCRFEGEPTMFVDPYSGGIISTRKDCLRRLAERTGLAAKELSPNLRTAPPRTIVIRFLSNLKALFWKQEDWSRWLPVQRRLAALMPTSYVERRDLGVAALKAGKTGEAIDLLRRCATSGPTAERSALLSLVREAENRHAEWN